ncbi:hypothetical protein NLI96_g11009 [Meripilus lineatus]|uniref:F-box domain-containing protein n=1 Tax=Meripilus lineatus TaxID=2056292 RepID=A0AAD5UU56_9APHY|nr:hypothetical protein NLI96_g11009 [Physisporinus lineatus]
MRGEYRWNKTRLDSNDVPLDFEHLIGPCIPHLIGDTQNLRVSLLQTFRESQERFGGFHNVEKIKLVLVTLGGDIDAASWELQPEERKRDLQKYYTAVIAIAKEFARSQTGLDISLTIDGLPPEELDPLISSVPTNELLWPIHIPIPWVIQCHIIACVASLTADGITDVLAFNDLTRSRRAGEWDPLDILRDEMSVNQTLRSCSLVCRKWAFTSQKFIFLWIRLSGHQQMDKLYTLLQDPQSSRLSQNVRWLSVVYRRPYKKIGEVIPRIIAMRLFNLECLDLCAGHDVMGLDYPIFPFHPSFRAQLWQLTRVRILHLHNFRFSHLTEFRRFVNAFSGIHHLIAIFVTFGEDNLGDYRLIRSGQGWQTPAKISWWYHGWWQDDKVYTPSILWMANITNSHRVIETSPSKATCPALTPDIANAIMHTTHYCLSGKNNYPFTTWHWQCENESPCGLEKDWTLICVSSHKTLDHYFRFRVGSDNPPHIPLGFENVIEVCITYLVDEPQELLASLLQKFQASQEQFGGFPNVERVKLTLLTEDGDIRAAPWSLQPEETKQMLQERYTPIIPIVKEFGRSQTDFQLDINIDGFPQEELRRLISTNKLLWPIHLPIPWNIQRRIIESVPIDGTNSVRAFVDLTTGRVAELRPIDTIRDHCGACRALRTCSLVCRQWASVSRKLIFHWICLSNYHQTDKLHSLLRDPQSSHLSQLVRRLSIVYHSPYKKIGEAIPRIIGMGLSRLECLDLCAGEGTGAFDLPTFPFHPSLRAQLSQLSQVRILHLHNFRFSHLAEFRRFVGAFAGIHHLIAIFVGFGRDELGDNRPIHRSKKWQMPAKISWSSMSWESWWNSNREAPDGFYAVSTFWLADIPNSQRAINLEAPCSSPTLTPGVANVIANTEFYYTTFGGYNTLTTWYWRSEKGGGGGPGQDWTLSRISSYAHQDHYFRFRMRSDNPPHTPLGCEHLIEPCLSHLITEPLGLLASLHERLQASEDQFGGFPNVEKVKLTLLTQDPAIHDAPWRLQPEETKRMLQERYTPIIPIIEEFRRSQTDSDFHLDINIDGFPPEELRLLISGVPTDRLLWPTHTPIPWNIQRRIIESVPNNGTNSVRAFADLTHDRVAEFQPISTIRDRFGACRTLRTFSLVCRRWTTVSQKLIFHWICLSNHRQTDKLHSLLRDPQSSHLSPLVRRLSIVYHSPYKKIGEAIPRIIGMGLSRLECLDLCAGEGTGTFDFPTFPFHPSLRAQLSQLNQVRILHLHNFRFSHLAEFRRFVCAFSGIHHLIAIFVDFERDKLGEYRPIHCSKEWQMPARVSWLSFQWLSDSIAYREAHDAIYTPSILWLGNIPNSHRVIKLEASCSRTTCPTLTPDVANVVMHTRLTCSITEGAYPLITWRWQCEEGTRSTDGLGQDWTLICISSHKYLDHHFRFRMKSDNPPDTPLGFEHLIEPCIAHLMTEPRELLASLHQKLRASQEQFGGFPNVERVKLTLLTQDGQIHAAPWRLQPEETKRMLQERYTPIIPIVQEFGRSQTDFQLDINIDGFPPEELRLLISDGQTTELSDERSIATIL